MTPKIFELSNEILAVVLGLVLNPSLPFRDSDGAIWPDIVSLRSTCRRFRQICNEMSFWYKMDCDLLDLLGKQHCSHDNGPRDFLTVLLSDRDLVRCLTRRSYWRFNNLASFRAVMNLVPSLYSTTWAADLRDFNVQYIFVRDTDEAIAGESLSHVARPHGVVPPTLQPVFSTPIQNFFFCVTANCHHLTTLRLTTFGEPREPLDLDLLTRSCPLLTVLCVEDIENYFGTLKSLSCLEELDIWDFPSHFGVTEKCIFPTNSATSLTQLSIIYRNPCVTNDLTMLWPSSLLDEFFNLTALCVSPLTNQICDFISHAKINLTDFRARVTNDAEVTANKIRDIFSARSLENLDHLRFVLDIDFHELRDSCYLALVPGITNCGSLRELYLMMPFKVSWCEQISQLVELNTLVWYIPHTHCYDSKGFPVPTDFEQPMPTEDWVRGSFEAAFGSFDLQPAMRIKVVHEIDIDIMSNWFVTYSDDDK